MVVSPTTKSPHNERSSILQNVQKHVCLSIMVRCDSCTDYTKAFSGTFSFKRYQWLELVELITLRIGVFGGTKVGIFGGSSIAPGNC